METTINLIKEKRKRNLKIKRSKKIKVTEEVASASKTDLNDLLDFDMMAGTGPN